VNRKRGGKFENSSKSEVVRGERRGFGFRSKEPNRHVRWRRPREQMKNCVVIHHCEKPRLPNLDHRMPIWKEGNGV